MKIHKKFNVIKILTIFLNLNILFKFYSIFKLCLELKMGCFIIIIAK